MSTAASLLVAPSTNGGRALSSGQTSPSNSQDASVRDDTLSVSVQELQDLITDMPDGRMPGIDLFCIEYLKILMGVRSSRKNYDHSSALETRFCSAFTVIINRLLAGCFPEEVSIYLRSNLLLALPKSTSDIRPIGSGCLLRKIVSKVIFRATNREFNKKHFGDLQRALQPAGMERILHEVELLRSHFPHWDTFTIDAENAFNYANRHKGLMQIKEHFPKALPFLKTMYSHVSCQFAFFEGKVYNIPSLRGFHQGDVLGNWCYMMTIQPLLNDLNEHLLSKHGANKHKIMFFVDDGNICGEHEVMVDAIKYLREHGPAYGYHIKPTKGAYLIGKCTSDEEAKTRFQDLTTVPCGLSEDIVHVHPDNNLRDLREEDIPAKYIGKTDDDMDFSYGMKMLCSYVGSNNYIKHKLSILMEDWKTIADRLVKFPFIQERMLLFRKCFSLKPIHILRTLARDLTNDFTLQFINLQKQILESMFGRDLDGEYMEWFSLPLSRGGLGFLNYRDVQHVAHIASVFGLKSFRESYVAILTNSPNHVSTFSGLIGHLHTELADLKSYLELPEEASDEAVVGVLHQIKTEMRQQHGGTFQNALYMKAVALKESEVYASLTDNNQRLHFKTIQDDTAAKWLQVYPKYTDLRITNSCYAINLNLRYFLEIPAISQCISSHNGSNSCPFCPTNSGKVDRTGHHFINGCARDVSSNHGSQLRAHFHGTHDYVRHTLAGCCKHALTFCSEEPSNVMWDTNKRPDIVSAFINGGVEVKHAVDLTIVSPFAGVRSAELRVSDVELRDPEHKANSAAQGKRAKYVDICNNQNMRFVPFVVYTSGMLHKDAKKFLTALSKHAAGRRNIKEHIIYNYYVKLLSVSLVKRIINYRANKL